MRIPFLRPKAEEASADDIPAARKPKRTRAPKAVPVVDDVLDVQTARTQARRRLIGAVVLLAIGVIGFPILFETKPRPMPMDTPMEAVRRDNAVGGLVARETTSPRHAPVTMPPADAGNEPAPMVGTAGSPPPVAAAPIATPATASSKPAASSAASGVVKVASAAAAPLPVPAAAPAPVPVPKASAPAAVPPPAPVAKAASSAAKPAAETAPSDAAPVRYVVQAGAYKGAAKLREARSKIEGLGYKTYTQVVENDEGSRTRVRVGPFPTREEAEAVVAKIKKSGLPAAIVKL